MTGQEALYGSSSLYTILGMLDEQNRFEWMRNLHGNKWIMLHGPSYIVLGLSKRRGSNKKVGASKIN